MSGNTKMLQAIIDGQRAIKEELKNDIKKVDTKVDKGFKEVKKEILNNRRRIDKLGIDLVELSDDAPTIEEFDKLEKRVTKLENQGSKN